jgi:hypothetical protein
MLAYILEIEKQSLNEIALSLKVDVINCSDQLSAKTDGSNIPSHHRLPCALFA